MSVCRLVWLLPSPTWPYTDNFKLNHLFLFFCIVSVTCVGVDLCQATLFCIRIHPSKEIKWNSQTKSIEHGCFLQKWKSFRAPYMEDSRYNRDSTKKVETLWWPPPPLCWRQDARWTGAPKTCSALAATPLSVVGPLLTGWTGPEPGWTAAVRSTSSAAAAVLLWTPGPKPGTSPAPGAGRPLTRRLSSSEPAEPGL